ncbi:MAG: MerR family transcriptional regulator [Spirochaetales bacterium]|nr:MerR family transcriptional regulator [Spirochaetales bacterium]
MLSIGEFSNICKVTTKTLRYYAEIGLILPDEIKPETGYRYYSIKQLEKMLFINRLKAYNFSLEEIKTIIESGELQDEKLFRELSRKKEEIEKQLQKYEKTIEQLDSDISNLKQGKSIMSYLKNIDVQLVEVPDMNLLFIRKTIHEDEIKKEYGICFGSLFRKITDEKLTQAAPPMVLFHSAEFSSFGLDTEFAVPVKDWVKGTRDFTPELCLKTILRGPYCDLSSVYTKQRNWAEKEGYEPDDALYEVYVTDPSQVTDESELITEVYYPVKKKSEDL